MKKILITFMALSLTACGTVSEIRHHKHENKVNLAGYDAVVIGQFEDKSKGKLDNDTAEYVNKRFSELLRQKITKTNAFSKVTIGDSNQEALKISGSILDYDNGNEVARLMLGFGAGSSYFKSEVNFTDNKTGQYLGHINVDKNSWAPGGAIAASQTGEVLMENAATSVAENLVKAGNTK